MVRDSILQEDLNAVVNSEDIDWEIFRNRTIAVTGATGLIGKITVLALLEADRVYHLNLHVLAFVRNKEKAEQIYENICRDSLDFVIMDIQKPVSSEIQADFLIHGASITSSKEMIEKPVETIMTTVEGTRNMLDFARRCEMQGMVYLSSMEVYGVVGSEQKEVREENLGYINPLEIRSSYSEGKRIAECLCAAYSGEYGVNVKIARLAQTFGAGIEKNENRVFAQFARSVMKKEDIILHTNGEKANCYCYTRDAVMGILVLLTKGEKGQAYNVANMETFCSIRQLAEVFIKAAKSEDSRLVFDIPENIASLGYAPSSVMRLNSEKMLSLGWKPQVNILQMAERLMKSMAESELL